MSRRVVQQQQQFRFAKMVLEFGSRILLSTYNLKSGASLWNVLLVPLALLGMHASHMRSIHWAHDIAQAADTARANEAFVAHEIGRARLVVVKLATPAHWAGHDCGQLSYALHCSCRLCPIVAGDAKVYEQGVLLHLESLNAVVFVCIVTHWCTSPTTTMHRSAVHC